MTTMLEPARYYRDRLDIPPLVLSHYDAVVSQYGHDPDRITYITKGLYLLANVIYGPRGQAATTSERLAVFMAWLSQDGVFIGSLPDDARTLAVVFAEVATLRTLEHARDPELPNLVQRIAEVYEGPHFTAPWNLLTASVLVRYATFMAQAPNRYSADLRERHELFYKSWFYLLRVPPALPPILARTLNDEGTAHV